MKLIEKLAQKPVPDKLLIKETALRDPKKFILKPNLQTDKADSLSYEQKYLWNVSLPGCGYEVVSILASDGFIYAGSNGYVYRLDLNGNVLDSNWLPDRGHCEITLAITDTHLVVGTNGYVVLVSLNNFDNTDCNINVSLPGCGHEKVSVLYDSSYIYAGSNGYAYKLEKNGRVIASNRLPNRGNEEVRLALTNDHLVVGTNGYVVLIDLNNFFLDFINVNISLPGCGHDIVSVLVNSNYIYAGSNGYVYKMNPDGSNIQTNNLPNRGNEEIRLAINESHLVVGTNGYVVLVNLNNFSLNLFNVNISLPGCGHEIVSVAVADGIIYAGSNGYAYELASQTGHVLVCYGLPGLSFHEIRFDIYNSQMYIGTNGYLAAPETIESLDVDLIGQETKQWCWAACGQMVMRYLGKEVSQCEQANYHFSHNDCCLKILTPQDCIRPGYPDFKYWGFSCNVTKSGTALSFGQLQQQINSKKPVAFLWKWLGGGGHYMVAKGYSKLSQMVAINNPSPPNKGDSKWIAYNYYNIGFNHLHGIDIYDISRDEIGERDVMKKDKVQESHSIRTYENSNEAAHDGLHRLLLLVNEHNYQEMGFSEKVNGRESLELGKKLKVFFIRHDELREYNKAENPFKLLTNINEHMFPVKHQGNIVSAITTVLHDKGWLVKSLGDSRLIKAVSSALKQIKIKDNYMLVTIPSLYQVFLGVKDNQNLKLIQLFNDNGKIDDYIIEDAREVLGNLQEDPFFNVILDE